MPPLRVVLGPGAFGRAADLAPWVEGLRGRGLETEAIELPRGRAERAAPTFSARAGPAVVAGGHSFGGRAASLAAASAPFAGLVLLSFPLLPGRRPAGSAARLAEIERRTAHWPAIGCPVLLVSGDRDPMAPIAELRARVTRLARARLVVVAGAGHDLGPWREWVLDEVAGFASALDPAS